MSKRCHFVSLSKYKHEGDKTNPNLKLEALEDLKRNNKTGLLFIHKPKHTPHPWFLM